MVTRLVWNQYLVVSLHGKFFFQYIHVIHLLLIFGPPPFVSNNEERLLKLIARINALTELLQSVEMRAFILSSTHVQRIARIQEHN